MNLSKDLERIEALPNWTHFVEPAWLRMSQAGRKYFNPDGTMPKDWLIESLNQQPFFGWYGWQCYPEPAIRECYERIADYQFRESDHSGMTRWGHTDWAWTRGTELLDYQNDVAPITALSATNLLNVADDASILFSDLRSVVHWGPGSGGYTFLMRQLGARHTEYMIDLPVVCMMQYDYLRHAFEEFGYGEVNLIKSYDDEIVRGAVNIVPLPFIDKVPQNHDLFIALHALNESSVDAQQYVLNRHWFNAEKVLLTWTEGLQENVDGELQPWGPGVANWESIVRPLLRSGKLNVGRPINWMRP